MHIRRIAEALADGLNLGKYFHKKIDQIGVKMSPRTFLQELDRTFHGPRDLVRPDRR